MATQPLSWKARLRYGLPARLGAVLPEAGPAYALRIAQRLERDGLTLTFGHFPANGADPDDIVSDCRHLAELRGPGGMPAMLAVKAPSLGFSPARITALAGIADRAGMTAIFDSHAPGQADQTLDIAAALLTIRPGTGIVLPSRWPRSLADADRFAASHARIRLVRGEWADLRDDRRGDEPFLALARRLAGRSALVGVGSHDPGLAEQALRILSDAGTPCELEQLRGLPRRRTMAVARAMGVPVRVYLPFGPGWWPYAIDKALARPHLPLWLLADLIGYRRGR